MKSIIQYIYEANNVTITLKKFLEIFFNGIEVSKANKQKLIEYLNDGRNLSSDKKYFLELDQSDKKMDEQSAFIIDTFIKYINDNTIEVQYSKHMYKFLHIKFPDKLTINVLINDDMEKQILGKTTKNKKNKKISIPSELIPILRDISYEISKYDETWNDDEIDYTNIGNADVDINELKQIDINKLTKDNIKTLFNTLDTLSAETGILFDYDYLPERNINKIINTVYNKYKA